MYLAREIEVTEDRFGGSQRLLDVLVCSADRMRLQLPNLKTLESENQLIRGMI
jgi:hypothetical protein